MPHPIDTGVDTGIDTGADSESDSGTAPARTPAELASAHRRAFAERFGPGGPPRAFFSPGRVNLMGAHLDYNGGPVMPMAIDRGTVLCVRERPDRRVCLASTREPGGIEVDLDMLPTARAGSWGDYPIGVLRALHDGGLPDGVPGLDVLYGGNLSIGAGLSSSASICVGTAFALDEVWRLGLEPMDRVQRALWAEREFVGVQCGIMDPYAVGLSRPGHLLWLDCRDRSTAHLPLDFDEVAIAVADTCVRRDLAEGAFNERVRECAAAYDHLGPHAPGSRCLRDVPLEVLERHGDGLPAGVRKRARHVLEEVERTFRARAALESGDVAGFGREMSAAHVSLREEFEVSIAELDTLVEAAVAWDGVLGSRLTGAGFGGCTVILLRRDAVGGFEEHLEGAFRDRHGRSPRIGLFGGDPGPREIPAD